MSNTDSDGTCERCNNLAVVDAYELTLLRAISDLYYVFLKDMTQKPYTLRNIDAGIKAKMEAIRTQRKFIDDAERLVAENKRLNACGEEATKF